MFPIPHFAPLYVDALGSVAAGIAAAIAGAIAVRIFGSKQREAAPVAQTSAGAGGQREDEPVPLERPAAPPASVRLALPPEKRAQQDGETEPRLSAVDRERDDSAEATDNAAS